MTKVLMRFVVFTAAAASAASVVYLYSVVSETRRLQDKAAQHARDVKKERDAIAVLRAERAYLARPERVDAAARKLGLAPAESNQFAPATSLAAKANSPRGD